MVGGITAQIVAQAGDDGEQLIVDVLMIAVMSSVARKGLGTKLLSAIESITKQLASSR